MAAVVVVVSRRLAVHIRREVMNVSDVCMYDAPLNGT